MKKASIKDWKIVSTQVGEQTFFALLGTLVSDETTRENVTVGKAVRTSVLKSIDFENDIAITQNTEYTLLPKGRSVL